MTSRRSHRDLVAAMRERVEITSPTSGTRAVVEDGGSDLAIERARAAIAAGRPLRPSERREVRSEVLARHSGVRAQRETPSIDAYLESLSERQRRELELTDWFANLDARHQADVRRRLAALEEDEAEAELLVAIEDERQALRDSEAAGQRWDELADASVAAYGARPEDDGLTDAERQAAADIARASAGPLYLGGPLDDESYSDDLTDGFDVDEEEDE